MAATSTSGDAATIADLAVKAAGVVSLHTTEDGRLFALLPGAGEHGGYALHDVSDPHREAPKPKHISQQVTLQTLDSLVDYVATFRTGTTVLLANIERNSIRAVLDYHGPDQPERLRHAATMVLPFSVEWQTWSGIDGKMLDQLEFARFIEENAADVAAPSGADLLEVCRDLQAVRKVNFTKAVRTNSDNESFEYTDETTASVKRGAVEIPSAFMLQIPVYFGEGSVSVRAFLRWRLVEGEGLKLGVRLHNPEHVRQAVFKQVVLTAAERSERPALFGYLG